METISITEAELQNPEVKRLWDELNREKEKIFRKREFKEIGAIESYNRVSKVTAKYEAAIQKALHDASFSF